MQNKYAKQKTGQRPLRVGELLRKILSTIFLRDDFDAPALARARVSINEVRLTSDLGRARIYVRLIGGSPQDLAKAVVSLNELAPSLRQIVGREIQLKYVPQLVFVADNAPDEAANIDKLLRDDVVSRDIAKSETCR